MTKNQENQRRRKKTKLSGPSSAIFLTLVVCFILSISIVSALNFDNIKSYDKETIKNTFIQLYKETLNFLNHIANSEEEIILPANSEEEIIERCSNLSLNETAKCLIGEIKLFYNYTKIDGDVPLSFERISSTGGDCSSYSFLYEKLGKELGFNATTRKYTWERDVFAGHRMAFIWDDNYYCKLDLIKIHCNERLDYE